MSGDPQSPNSGKMHLLSSHSSGWIDPLDLEHPDGRAILESRLRQLLGAERLVVLSGLGTTRCIAPLGDDPGPPSMADLWSRSKGAVSEETWAAALNQTGWSADLPDDIELLLSRCQMVLSLGADESLQTFVESSEREIVKACRFVQDETPLPTHEAFLRHVARRPTRLPRTQVFTTNYDLAYETAAARTGFAVVDGFSHAAPQRFDGGYFDVDLAIRDRERAATPVDWVPNVFHLLKLHGSVDWRATSTGVTRDPTATRPLIVYPRASKFEISYQQPFLELMGRFQTALRRPDTGLIVVGSGLSDRHLAEPVLAAIRSNVRLSVLLVSPSLETSEEDHVQRVRQYIEGGDRRLSMLAGRFEDFVPLLPELVPESEAEQHASRTI